MQTKDWWDVGFAAAQLVATLVTAAWVYSRFRREGPNQPRIEFRLACTFLGPQRGAYVAAFTVTAVNRGFVEHRFTGIRLKVLAIKAEDELREWQGHEPRLHFPTTLFRGAELVPKDFVYFFVRPGVEQEFSFTTPVGEGVRFIVARATFQYESSGDIHTVERVFEVKAG